MTESSTPGERSLDPRFINYQRAGSCAFFGVMLLVALLVNALVVAFNDFPLWLNALLLGASVAIPGALIVWGLWWPTHVYRHMRYRLDEQGMWIRRGVWFRSETSIPITRVQHTDVTQGPLERLYSLGTLIVYTAGTQHASESLPGLAHDDALRLRDELVALGESDGV